MPIALCYHDVVPPEEADASGFRGADASRYKLAPSEFRQQLDALAKAAAGPPRLAVDLASDAAATGPWLLTFDDGGLAAHTRTADLLEEKGWRGHFLITAGRVGTPAFMSAPHLRALHQRGHVIGTHSYSHPERMSACGWEQLVHEWRRSQQFLADVLGAPVTVASVPGGHYSRSVAKAAAQVGIKVLFTSEPTARPHRVDGCLVLGRYTVYRGMSAERVAAFVAGRTLLRLQQTLMWNVKKAAKLLGGRFYLRLRKRLLTLAEAGRADDHLTR